MKRVGRRLLYFTRAFARFAKTIASCAAPAACDGVGFVARAAALAVAAGAGARAIAVGTFFVVGQSHEGEPF